MGIADCGLWKETNRANLTYWTYRADRGSGKETALDWKWDVCRKRAGSWEEPLDGLVDEWIIGLLEKRGRELDSRPVALIWAAGHRRPTELGWGWLFAFGEFGVVVIVVVGS